MQGFYSNLPITCGVKVAAFLCVKSKRDDYEAPLYAIDYMEPICLPIYGTYEDCGKLTDIERNETTELIEKYSGMSVEDFINNVMSECNGQPISELRDMTEEKNRCHFAKPGVIKFFENVLIESKIEPYMDKLFERYNGNDSEEAKELMGLLTRMKEEEENRQNSISLCVIYERRDVYEEIIKIAMERKPGYFWTDYEKYSKNWDKYYYFTKELETRYGVKRNIICDDYDDCKYHSDILDEHYEEVEELEKKYGIKRAFDNPSPYYFGKCGGFHTHANALYKKYEGDVSVFKEEYIRYALFFSLFIRMYGTFNFSPYGGQEFPYEDKIKLLKKEIEILEEESK